MTADDLGLELDIARLGAQGDGVAETPAGPLYVAFALPGERVRVERDSAQGEHARLLDVVSASAARIAPVCRHFGGASDAHAASARVRGCGGCVAQHMSPTLYRDWKHGIVAQAFAHRGLAPEIAEIVSVQPGTRRRASMTARRAGDRITLGFHVHGSDDLVAITECPVMMPEIVAALPALRELAMVVLADGKSLHLAATATLHGLDVIITGVAGKHGPLERSRLGRIAAANGIVRLTCDGDMILQKSVPVLRRDGVDIGLPIDVFVQATAQAETAIADLITAAVGKAKRVADLFSGVGTFTFPLAKRARVLAVDSDAPAIAALAAAARNVQGLKPIETRVRDLLREPLSRKELEGIDAVVFDPPRAGAKAQAEMLVKSKVGIVVAVSCNPATLARDARILIDGGYTLDRVTPIDQFVWSAHIEAVAVFRRA